jgi:hypothetical protein
MLQSIVDITGTYIGEVKDGQRNGHGIDIIILLLIYLLYLNNQIYF